MFFLAVPPLNTTDVYCSHQIKYCTRIAQYMFNTHIWVSTDRQNNWMFWHHNIVVLLLRMTPVEGGGPPANPSGGTHSVKHTPDYMIKLGG